MQQDARLDTESGLYTQRMLEVLLAHEVARAKRYPNPISVVYLALRFDAPPDDEIVESARLVVAHTLHSKLREVDMPGLYEGNYLVILPATEPTGAATAASRLAQQIRGKQVTRNAKAFELSLCLGISTHSGGPTASAAELLSQAAAALWEAQRRGPQSVVLFSELETTAASPRSD